MSPDASALASVREFQSETDAIRELPVPLWARLTPVALAGMFACVIGLMFVTRMDRVVTSQGGKIVVTEQVNVYQALEPSIIKSIDVREGDEVQHGQLLATLDPTFVIADVQQLRLQIASLEAQIARAQAEADGRPFVPKPSSDPDEAKYQALQKELFDQRTNQYGAQVNSFDAKIKQVSATIGKLEGDAGRYGQREQIAKRIEEMRTTLAEHGTGSQLNMLVSQDQRLELLRTIENTNNGLVEARQMLASLRADRQAFIQQWLGTLTQELVKARNDLDTARSQLEKASKRQDLVKLTASEPSVVLTMAKLSVGSVLKQGDAIFTLMPLNVPIEAEIRIAARDIGFVRPGDPCSLKIDAFHYTEHGSAEGKIRWISEGAFTVDDNGKEMPAYYKARCTVDDMRFVNVPPKFRLIPGMTLEADLKIGTRSVAMYMLRGVVRGYSEAMREP